MLIKADKFYLKNLKKILTEGCKDVAPRPKYNDGTPAHSLFITHVFETYDISKGEYPITTLRNTAIKSGINEILWIYQKQTSSLKDARNMGVTWWDNWDIGDGTIGQRYGATVKRWNLIDSLLDKLKNDPFGRRHVLNLYQESDLNETEGLYPCAFETIWSVRKKGSKFFLDLFLNQRSNDYIVAGYINKIQYVALQMMIASVCNYEVGKFSHFVNNLHIYDRHINAAKEILNRHPLPMQPYIELKNKRDNFYDFKADDFVFYNIEGIKKLSSPLELAI